MLYIALTLLIMGVLIWVILFLTLKAGSKVSRRADIGGGATPYPTEPWSNALDNESLNRVGYQDVRLLDNIYNMGVIGTLDELELRTKESTEILADRLKRLEELGLVIRTGTGQYEITEYGRKLLERYREKALMRRREEELVEGR